MMSWRIADKGCVEDADDLYISQHPGSLMCSRVGVEQIPAEVVRVAICQVPLGLYPVSPLKTSN